MVRNYKPKEKPFSCGTLEQGLTRLASGSKIRKVSKELGISYSTLQRQHKISTLSLANEASQLTEVTDSSSEYRVYITNGRPLYLKTYDFQHQDGN